MIRPLGNFFLAMPGMVAT